MSLCTLKKLEGLRGVYLLTMMGDGEHRLCPAFLNSFSDALDTVQNSEDARALITSNEGKYFSNGVDLDWLNVDLLSRASPLEQSINRALMALLTMNVPTIAAISGHTVAGGVVLALAHDHRLMRKDRGFLFVNELEVGINFTPSSMSLMKSKLSPKVLKDMVLGIQRHTATTAYEAQIIDSVHESSAETLDAAIQKASDLSKGKWCKTHYQRMRKEMYPEIERSFDFHKNYLDYALPSKL